MFSKPFDYPGQELVGEFHEKSWFAPPAVNIYASTKLSDSQNIFPSSDLRFRTIYGVPYLRVSGTHRAMGSQQGVLVRASNFVPAHRFRRTKYKMVGGDVVKTICISTK